MAEDVGLDEHGLEAGDQVLGEHHAQEGEDEGDGQRDPHLAFADVK